LKDGINLGETHTCVSSSADKFIINHPIDCYFSTDSCDGWPVFVCEVM
jgi:hypothetical protein